MKTTLDIPDELFHAAKSRAALAGIKLEDIVAEGLRLALDAPKGEPARRSRARFPLIRSRRPGSMNLTGKKIAEMEAKQEAQFYGKFMRR